MNSRPVKYVTDPIGNTKWAHLRIGLSILRVRVAVHLTPLCWVFGIMAVGDQAVLALGPLALCYEYMDPACSERDEQVACDPIGISLEGLDASGMTTEQYIRDRLAQTGIRMPNEVVTKLASKLDELAAHSRTERAKREAAQNHTE